MLGESGGLERPVEAVPVTVQKSACARRRSPGASYIRAVCAASRPRRWARPGKAAPRFGSRATRRAAEVTSKSVPYASKTTVGWARRSQVFGCAMPVAWKPPSTKITSPVVQAPRSRRDRARCRPRPPVARWRGAARCARSRDRPCARRRSRRPPACAIGPGLIALTRILRPEIVGEIAHRAFERRLATPITL